MKVCSYRRSTELESSIPMGLVEEMLSVLRTFALA